MSIFYGPLFSTGEDTLEDSGRSPIPFVKEGIEC